LNGFQLFGLKRPADSSLKYLTFDEGLQLGLVEVTEVSDAGRVPTLKVANKGEVLLFLMSGEQLEGGKQNRVLNVSIMVDARSEVAIPVSCVEAGRWHYQSMMFGSKATASHSFLRRTMSK